MEAKNMSEEVKTDQSITDETITQLRTQIQEKGKEAILDILGSSYDVTDPKLKSLMLEYKDILLEIRKENLESKTEKV